MSNNRRMKRGLRSGTATQRPKLPEQVKHCSGAYTSITTVSALLAMESTAPSSKEANAVLASEGLHAMSTTAVAMAQVATAQVRIRIRLSDTTTSRNLPIR